MLRFILIHLVLLNNVRQVCTRGSFNITVLHTNDLHGRYDEIDRSGFTCDASELKQKKCLGGVARLATVIKQVRNREENVVLLDGGDRLSGSIWTEVYRGNATRTFVNELNYTAVVRMSLTFFNILFSCSSVTSVDNYKLQFLLQCIIIIVTTMVIIKIIMIIIIMIVISLLS